MSDFAQDFLFSSTLGNFRSLVVVCMFRSAVFLFIFRIWVFFPSSSSNFALGPVVILRRRSSHKVSLCMVAELKEVLDQENAEMKQENVIRKR